MKQEIKNEQDDNFVQILIYCEEPDDIVLISDGITEAEVYAKELVLV